MTYKFKTKPFEHQLNVFNLSRDLEAFALLMEQGTGKSKVIVDNAAYLWGLGRINALLIVAPNGVHRNWIINELPNHLPDYVQYRAAWYSANERVKERKAIESLFDSGDFLRVLTINVEAFVSKKAKDLVKKFLTVFDTLMVVDESSRIKSVGAARTKTIISLGKYAKYRRILTGTPVTQSPLDIYSQFKFLDDDILGTSSYYAFKARYSELLDESSHLMRHIMQRTKSRFAPQVIASDANGKPIYRNLDELKARIAPYSFRVLKVDCLDLPLKLYQRHYYELPAGHKKTYDTLRDKAKLEWAGDTTKVQKLNLLMRLQQVTHGYVPVEGMQGVQRMYDTPQENPAIAALLDVLSEIHTPVIIWARFIAEIEDILTALSEEYPDDKTVAYYGAISPKDRTEAVAMFEAGQARFFVGQQQSGGIGLTLVAASTVLYFSNDCSLENRLQSEDRAHRIGQTSNVTYVDLEAVDTVDKKIIDILVSKKSTADLITGDETEWLQSI